MKEQSTGVKRTAPLAGGQNSNRRGRGRDSGTMSNMGFSRIPSFVSTKLPSCSSEPLIPVGARFALRLFQGSWPTGKLL